MSKKAIPASVNEIDKKLKIIVFKACHLAVWTDRNMTADERRYLSYLTEILCNTQAERKIFKEIQLNEINEDLLVAEIKKLNSAKKVYVFDKCLEVLASDKLINIQELKFLKILRKACGINYWTCQKKISRECHNAKARIFSKKHILFIVLFPLLLGISVILIEKTGSKKSDEPIKGAALEEKCTGKDISISVIPAGSSKTPPLTTGQEVFEQSRDSIVFVKVFADNDPVCTGSGFVIGSDESGLLYIVTNKHVVQSDCIKEQKKSSSVKVEVQQHSGAKFDTTLDFYSRDLDLAILAVKGMAEYAKPLKLILRADLEVGQTVYAIGSPIGLKHSFTAGVISALRDDSLQTDATVFSGSSGGPLIEGHGFLCGVVTSGHIFKDYSFAQYSDAIVEMLKERKKLKMDKETSSTE
jgi:V8-like Glu-specific endopeptidase